MLRLLLQVLALRLLRLLLRSDAMAAALTAVDAAAALTELLATSPYGAVREEALAGLGHLAGASGACSIYLVIGCHANVCTTTVYRCMPWCRWGVHTA